MNIPTTECFYLYTKSVYTEHSIESSRYILIDKGVFQGIYTQVENNEIPIIYFDQYHAIPGLLDLHIHGRNGADVMDATPEAINTISQSLVQHGVVGFLATTVTSTWDNTLAAFSNIAKSYQSQPRGAQVLGAYNEGLFFTEDHKGAHDEQYFQPLTQENIDAIVTAAKGALKVVALAPELPNSDTIIRYLNSIGVKTMLGHTNANFQQTSDALKAGACGGVHVFNGMKGIHHREPGCTGAVLHDKNAYVEVIADGIHLHPTILDLVHRLKGTEKMGLVSDCIVAGGMPDGKYSLGMLEVIVEKGIARTKEGALAGSTLTLEEAILNITTLTNIPALDAVNMASLSPAKFLGIEDSLGSISVGKRACLAIVDDNFNVKATVIDGKFVYQT